MQAQAVGQRRRYPRWRCCPAARSHYDSRVVALEDIEVPVGRDKAYRIEARGEAALPKSTNKLSDTSWIDPAMMTLVRQDMRPTSHDGAKVHEHSSMVLRWRKQVPRA